MIIHMNIHLIVLHVNMISMMNRMNTGLMMILIDIFLRIKRIIINIRRYGMPNRKDKYYLGDIITFRGVFKIDGTEQTPDADSAKIQIWKKDALTATVAETAATISANQIQYKHTPAAAGEYTAFIYATFENGADKRTGVIEFIVLAKKSY